MAWQDLANESTADLIEYIRWGNQPEYKNTAEDAFRVFCFRFSPELQRTCRIICANRSYDATVADDIAEKTFARFLKYPKYDHSKCKCGEIDKCVLLYLYKFARRILSDYAIAEKRLNPFTGEEEIVTEFWDIEAMEIPHERKAQLLKQYEILKGALERLSPKHKIIYLTYKEYEEELKSGYNFPAAFRKRLQDELGLTQASIRVYKKEAFDKVDEYLKYMAQNNLNITPDNVTEWLASTGFIFPRTVLELARFEKSYRDVQIDLTGCEIDPDVILGTKSKANIISIGSKSKESKEPQFRMAARKGDSNIPKHIMDKIKKNQDKRKQDDSGSEKERPE